MKFVCERITLSGIKNLISPIIIDLLKNKKVKEENKKRIVAIYGPNGSGKTAIIHAVEIFRNLLTENNYLLDNSNKKYVYNLINKSTKEFSFTVDFHLPNDLGLSDHPASMTRFSYQITLSIDDDQSVTIKEEKLLASTLASQRKTTKVYFHSIQGKIIESALAKPILAKLENTIKRRSFAEVCEEILREELKNPTNENNVFCLNEKRAHDILYFAPIAIAASKMDYFLLQTDAHSSYAKDFETLWDDHCHPRLDDEYKNFVMAYRDDSILVKKTDINAFLEAVKKLTHFIRLFKPDLCQIQMDKKENPDYYIVNLILSYENYQIHEDFESAGLRKLIQLFFSLLNIHQGDILFVDELDSSINDVYLVRLVEYFLKFGKGQVVFTTHSVAPMDVLKNEKDAIAFINACGEWSYWKRLGSYSPGKLYKEGYIKGLPFNIHAVDFGSVFNDNGE